MAKSLDSSVPLLGAKEIPGVPLEEQSLSVSPDDDGYGY